MSEDVSTTEIMEFLRDNMATKEDLRLIREEMATKEDLWLIREEMVTKEDLKNYATKDDLVNFTDEILTAVDSLACQHTKHDQEIATLNHNYKGLEQRVAVLEENASV